MAPGQASELWRIDGLDCPDCAAKLAQVIGRLPAVAQAELTYANSRLRVDYQGAVGTAAVEQCIRQMGYRSQLLTAEPGGAKLRIRGLDCPDCAAKLEQQLRRLPGVVTADLVFASGLLDYRPAAAEAALIAAIERAGYQAEPVSPLAESLVSGVRSSATGDSFWRRNRRFLTTAASGLLLAAGWAAELWLHQSLLARALFLLGMLAGGFYVARSGVYALRNRTLDMNFLMSVAAIGAVVIGEWHEGAMVVFLFSLGNTLQAYTMDRTRQSIRSLVKLAPKEALVRREDHERLMPTEQILLGDLVVVRPGERIAMDGIVMAGSSAVNQAPITGESLPVDKVEGDRVFAGTINGNGSLEVSVDRLVGDNTLSRIMHLVEEAQAQRAPAQTLVDRFAALYTPIVIGLAVGLAVLPPLLGADFLSWFKRALILLVVSCPCALVISTPVSIVSAIGNASRQGVLIKGGAYLEAIGRIRTVAFDKTGTLTAGQVVLTNLLAADGDAERVLRSAAALESRSEHPLAQAVSRAALAQDLLVPAVRDFRALVGSGATGWVADEQLWIGNERVLAELHLTPDDQLQASVDSWQSTGQTVVYLTTRQRVLGVLGFADQLRPGAAAALRQLRSAGVQAVAMLTGDHQRSAAAIGQQLDIDTIKAELLPEGKVTAINQLLAEYQQVAMVGDGVNDAPALAASTVGIALGAAGTDAAIETADIALMADDLGKLAFLMRLSRQTLRIIGQNIGISLLIKGVVLALTLVGRAELWMGVLADSGAALVVIANGMRLMRVRS